MLKLPHKPSTKVLKQFHWEPQPAAQRVVDWLVTEFLAHCSGAAEVARRMKEESGTRFKDWIDYILVPARSRIKAKIKEVGFDLTPLPGAQECYVHHGAMFPPVILGDDAVTRIGIKAESVSDFLAAWQITNEPVQGEPLGQFRTARAFRQKEHELWVVERHGHVGFEVPKADPMRGFLAVKHLEAFRRRPRDLGDDHQGFARLNRLIDTAIADLGRDWACDLFFAAERDYWQRRNRAAQVQKARQDKIGLGWANHDHHTYRSSREHFMDLIAVQEKLGFKARERFYAGAEAGWGAQVMEHAATGITTFNDVDLSPQELMGDLGHERLSPRKELGTVGLWVGLHGEAILQAGMHHLECQFDWLALVDQLSREAGIRTMGPFTTFPYLRQAFTEGERWQVSEKRLKALLDRHQITQLQAEQFRIEGAIGSHLENLERNDGFKGFNQKGVSDIIARTDPRRQTALAGA
jgi:hypothetical protein